MLSLPWSSYLGGPGRAAIRPASLVAGAIVCALVSPLLRGAVPASNEVETRAAFNPGVVWRDENGNAINAHGGGVTFFEGTYYWYGEHKVPGKIDSHHGDFADGGVHAYSSTDLVRWKDEGIVLPVQEEDPQRELAYGCTLERPKVLFNERTRTFVMFFKYYPRGTGYDTGYVGVATAASPTGPFLFRHTFLGADSPKGSGDFAMFQDIDGAVYHLTVRKPDRVFCIGKLRDDYLFPEGPYRVVAGIPLKTEAPAVMRRVGKYYLIGSGSSGWMPNAARAFVADSIGGPYESTGNPCVGENPHLGLGQDKTFGGQISFLLPVVGKREAFIGMFDIWKPDAPSQGLYAWLPVMLENGKPVVAWRTHWALSVFDEMQTRIE